MSNTNLTPFDGELYGLFLHTGGRRYDRYPVTHTRPAKYPYEHTLTYLCGNHEPRLVQSPDRTVLDLHTGLRYRNFGHWLKFRDEGLPHD